MAASYQFLSTPAKLPKEWQPNLHSWSPYKCSHPDVAQAGWRKWGGEYPDWYAHKSSSTHPDWYNRRVNSVRRVDYKNTNWHYERPSKPTSRTHDGFIPFTNEVRTELVQMPIPQHKDYRGSFTFPKPFPMEVPVPKWGIHHPDHYEEPMRLNHFPPIKHPSGY